MTKCMERRLLKAFVVAVIALVALAGSLPAQEVYAGTPVSGFTLRDMRGHLRRYRSQHDKVTVVMFFSTRCPMSNAFNYRRNVLYQDYGNRVRFIVVDSNANEPLAEVKTYAKDTGFNFEVHQDVDNRLADLLGVRSTTENLVLDTKGVVRYRGYIENSPNPARTTSQGLRLALDAVLAGQPVATPETKAIGCAIRRAHLLKPVNGVSTNQ
jgi:peroxiredoxin